MSASEFRIPFQPALSFQPAENADQFKLCQCGEGDPTSCPNCQVLKSGHLLISSKGIGWTSWKKRWFILTRTSLMFFRSDPNVPPPRGSEPLLTLGGLDLNNSGSVVVKEEKKLLTVLFPDGCDGRTFTLKAETAEELNDWKTALENALAQAPNTANMMGQNPIFRNGITEPAEDPVEQSNGKSIIGRPPIYALEDPDGRPSFLEKALRFIEEYGVKVEGVLRQSADVEEVKRRLQDYEKGKNEFCPEEDAHVIGDCIKYILREMPSAPVPTEYCTALVGAFRTNRTRRLDAMHTVIYEVFSEPNRRLLQRVLQMMQVVASHKDVNRMSLSALAACMAPLLLQPLLAGECELDGEFNMSGDGSMQLLQAAAAANHAQAIIIVLLEEYEQIFDDLEEGCCSSDAYTESEDGDDRDYSTDNDMPEDDGSYFSGEDEDMDDNVEHSSGGTASECGSNIAVDVLNDKVVKNNSSEEDASRSTSRDPSHATQESCEPNGSVGHLVKSNTHPSSSKASKLDKSSSSMHKSKRATVWGRTSARKNLSTHEIDYCSDDEIFIEQLEASKSDLQAKLTKEVKENAILQASLEKRKGALHERRLALEKEVEKLRDQLQKERNFRASLGYGMINMRRGQVSCPSAIDSKREADLEEVASAEADVFNLKQKVSDLRGQINNKAHLSSTSLCESCGKQLLNTNEPVKDEKIGTISPEISSTTETLSIAGSNSLADMVSTMDGGDFEQLMKQTMLHSPSSTGATYNEETTTISQSGAPKMWSPNGDNMDSQEVSSTSRWGLAQKHYSPQIKLDESGAAPTSALAKLTSRLNFLKERRVLLASEMQNLDLTRALGPAATASQPSRTDSK